MQGPAGQKFSLLGLPADLLNGIAAHLTLTQRVTLAQVCKQLFHVTRVQGTAMWNALPITFHCAEQLASFAKWRRRCSCAPVNVWLEMHPWRGVGAKPVWDDVVSTFRLVAPSLTSLMIRWSSSVPAEAGSWLLEAVHLTDLALYCNRLTISESMSTLTKLQELSLESPDAQLVIAPHASLPPNLTRLFAVDCFLTDVPVAMCQLPHLQCAYLSRNPLHAASLSRLADLHRLELLSLIGCWLERPPPQLSVMTSLRACYLDYNECGVGDSEHDTQSAFSTAFLPLPGLEALGLSHQQGLDIWPTALDSLTRLKVLYLESNHELVELPSTAAATLARLRLLSCDASLLFANAGMFRAAAQRLQHLYISGNGLSEALVGRAASVADVLAALAAMKALKRVTFVVQTQREEVASVEVTVLHVKLQQHLPKLAVDAIDSESFFGVTLSEIDALA
ncbi:hypothetical protein D9Q98_009764 [Chlorella vulgaris]|uniref:F-box domain-containing protein n=1 Tax=Chlorella vulgaris TaxID=3077 RepID=A0A9D4TF13_CHLVU|nr:hypothetical protein D9Q98_009764 [Chlorella vulgaris]